MMDIFDTKGMFFYIIKNAKWHSTIPMKEISHLKLKRNAKIILFYF
jgi:hypothetical protein